MTVAPLVVCARKAAVLDTGNDGRTMISQACAKKLNLVTVAVGETIVLLTFPLHPC